MPKRLPPIPIGEKFGDWTVISEPFKKTYGGKFNSWVVKAQCGCGVIRAVQETHLRNARTSRCKKCSNLFSNRTHGMAKSQEYRIWQQMIMRCYNKFHAGYRNYGAKGVVVCDRWNPAAGGSFENFYKDVGPRPSKDHQLDKEAVFIGNKVYGPRLASWTPRSLNNRRKFNTIFVEFKGKKIALAELADKFNINYHNLYYRVIAKGMSPDEAVLNMVGSSKIFKRSEGFVGE